MIVIDSTVNRKKSGVAFRKGRSGPEQDLVDWFLELHAVRPKRGERLTIFREPRLPSGFPDIVAVVWKESVASGWRSERRQIKPIDLRVIHHLATNGPAEPARLNGLFGRETEQSLRRLRGSEMAVLQGGLWKARPLSKTFAIQRIVAIEAKINAWRVALGQAFVNTWFTPESYILLPELPKRTNLIDTALQHGVGVLCKEHLNFRPQRIQKPISYASWLFNEWTWRLAAV